MTENNTHLTTSNTIRDVVNHPAFEGFGRFVLPLDRGSYDANMPLENVGSLLPYHSNVDPNAVVNTLNYMIDAAGSGETMFYDVYTSQQKKSDPTKESTGLFFFRGEPGAPFAVISPGGGFSYVGSVHEGFPHAIELSQKGYNAFVLQYRVGGEQVATEDLAAALSFIFENAATLDVSTENYSVWGSSAGARMAARIGSYGPAEYGGAEIPRPGTVIMAYTGHSDFTTNDPPTFAVVGARDGIANPATMEQRINSMRSAGIPVEFHLYPNVGHGFGLGTGTTAEGWLDDAVRFWESHMSASLNSAPTQNVDSGATRTPAASEQQLIYIWEQGNIPTTTVYTENPNGQYFDPPDFQPNVVYFPAKQGVTVKGAVLVAAGGAFNFRSDGEGAPVAQALSELGYQSFVVNYRLRPYSMQEGALDLGRAVRYVRDHAAEYDIDEKDIAVIGFSAGGILWGELLLNFDGTVNGTAIDPAYVPDELDKVSADASAVGMIYSFYGRLSVASTDVDKFKNSDLPPAFFAYGTRDPFVREFEENIQALREADVPVEDHVLQDWPHGFGARGEWIPDFDNWLTQVFEND